MALIGDAAMVAIYDLEEGWAERHDDWHSHEHMQERVAIAGFRRGRRYVADGDGARCFVFYEVESLATLTSEAYLERLNNPTPWSAQTMPRFRNMTRTLCRVSMSRGEGVGGHMGFVALSAQRDHADALRGWIDRQCAELVKQPGILCAHLMEGDPTASAIRTRETELRGDTDTAADWLLVVEGYAPIASVFEHRSLSRDALIENGATTASAVLTYSLGAVLSQEEL